MVVISDIDIWFYDLVVFLLLYGGDEMRKRTLDARAPHQPV